MRFSIKKEQSLSKKLHEGGCQEVAACGHDASRDLGSPCSGGGSYGAVEIEETDGTTSLSLFM